MKWSELFVAAAISIVVIFAWTHFNPRPVVHQGTTDTTVTHGVVPTPIKPVIHPTLPAKRETVQTPAEELQMATLDTTFKNGDRLHLTYIFPPANTFSMELFQTPIPCPAETLKLVRVDTLREIETRAGFMDYVKIGAGGFLIGYTLHDILSK